MSSQETVINEKDKLPSTNLKALQDLNKKIDECLLSNQNKFRSQNNSKSLLNNDVLLEKSEIHNEQPKNISKQSNGANIQDTIIELDRQITERLQKLGKIDEISYFPQNKKNNLESIKEEDSDCEKSLSEIKFEIIESSSFKKNEESQEILKEIQQNYSYDINCEKISEEGLITENVAKNQRNSLELDSCKTFCNLFERKKSASFYSNSASTSTESTLKNKHFKEKFMEVNMKLKKFNKGMIPQKELNCVQIKKIDKENNNEKDKILQRGRTLKTFENFDPKINKPISTNNIKEDHKEIEEMKEVLKILNNIKRITNKDQETTS